jgi:hypothetical protein
MSPTRYLSAAEDGQLARFREAWDLAALSTDPADRPTAEAAMRRVYERGGLAPPDQIIWCDSPAAMVRRNLDFTDGGENVWHSVGATVAGRAWQAIWAELENEMVGRVLQALKDTAWRKASDLRTGPDENGTTNPEPGMSIAYALDGADGPSSITVSFCRAREIIFAGRTGEYYWDSEWMYDLLPGYAFMADELGATAPNELDGLIALARSAGPWLARERVALISERPTVLRLDERDRLHCGDGPALKWRNGHAVYALEGVRVPGWAVDPMQLTAAAVQQQPNVEVRRVLLQQFGVERFIREAHTEVVAVDRYGRLLQARLRGEEPLTLVELTNATPEPDGTRKTYYLRVPPWVQSAQEAVAWTFDVDASEYAPMLES